MLAWSVLPAFGQQPMRQFEEDLDMPRRDLDSLPSGLKKKPRSVLRGFYLDICEESSEDFRRESIGL